MTSLSFKCFHHFVTVLWLIQYNELPFLCTFHQFLHPLFIAVGSQIFILLWHDAFNVNAPSGEYTHVISGQMTMISNWVQVGYVSYISLPLLIRIVLHEHNCYISFFICGVNIWMVSVASGIYEGFTDPVAWGGGAGRHTKY